MPEIGTEKPASVEKFDITIMVWEDANRDVWPKGVDVHGRLATFVASKSYCEVVTTNIRMRAGTEAADPGELIGVIQSHHDAFGSAHG
jgi:hypothetical protein